MFVSHQSKFKPINAPKVPASAATVAFPIGRVTQRTRGGRGRLQEGHHVRHPGGAA
jgi:hypothetical protein